MSRAVVILLCGACLVSAVGCAPRQSVKTTEVVSAATHGSATQSIKIDDKTISTLKTEWASDFLTAEGSAPIVNKYDDVNRNLGLAKVGARTDAEAKLARQISEVHVTETIVMRDLETSSLVTSEVRQVLKDVEVLNERCDQNAGMCYVTVRMPKTSLVRVVESYNH
jgi:hypothetical protein